MTELTSFVVLVALTTGVVEVLKRALSLSSNVLPLLALVVGIVLTFLGNTLEITSLSVLAGIATGLSSAGLFDQTKLFKK